MSESLNRCRSEVPRVRNVLREIVLGNETVEASAKRTLETTTQGLEVMAQQLAIFPRQLAQLCESFSALDSLSRSATLSIPSQPSTDERFMSRSQGVDNHSYSRCTNGLCMCNCHKSSTFVSPQWAKSVIGVIIISWCGVIGHPICNERRCQRSRTTLLKLSYHFPTWFISRMISLRSRFTRLEGPVLSLRTPRTVSPTSPSFGFAISGCVQQLQNALMKGLASPFDVEGLMGTSSLGVCTN